MPQTGAQVQILKGGKMSCREATPAEALVLTRRDPSLRLHKLTPPNPQTQNDSTGGLKIIFRATSQLENFPAAKEAFVSVLTVCLQKKLQHIISVNLYTSSHWGPWQ